jgi:S-formylglutathione hydrolase FrmB
MRTRLSNLCLPAGVIAAVAASALTVVIGVAPAWAAPQTLFRNSDGIHVLSVRRLDARLLALTVVSDALPGPADVRILLPSGYGSSPRRRYPVLYLLHGTDGGAADWTAMGDAERTTAGRPLIVVMPDIGLGDDGGGWCANWYNAGAGGQPEWERFHIDQLIPWVDHNLRTIAARSGRAIAGLSQGAFCAISYAARHPNLFSAALSFSGPLDIAYDASARAMETPIINFIETDLDGVAANSIFGPRSTEELNWADHDPTTLAGNLRGMRLALYTGNGRPGPLDTGPANALAESQETDIHQLTLDFHRRLQTLGIPSTLHDYGPGTHSWPYWARDLRWSIGWIMAGFASPLPAPAAVTYTSADSVYTVFGWRVVTHRRVREFSTLRDARAARFELQGSGSATVTTPARFRHHARYLVTSRSSGGTVNSIVRSDDSGRLTIRVALGPSDTVQEDTAVGLKPATTIYATRVTVTPVAAS